MRRLRLLFLTPQLPYPARQGTAIRNWGIIRHLAHRHDVRLMSFLAPGQDPDAPEARLAGLIAAVPQPPWSTPARVATLLAGYPDLTRRLWSPAFASALAQALLQFTPDVVVLEGLELAGYLETIRRVTPAAKIVYDAHNAEHLIQRRAWQSDRTQVQRWLAGAYSAVQIGRLERAEAFLCAQVDAVTCVSAEDAAALTRLAPEAQLAIIPNGIDTEGFVPGSFAAAPGMKAEDLVYTGKMDYRPNVDAVLWFADAVLPRIRAERPGARLIVVGQQPGRAVLRLASQEGIVVTGAVSDTRPYIAGAAAFVAPLRMGGGTRFKLLEAMALARPIVATPMGAEGFAVQHERELLLADRPDGLAAACLRVMGDAHFAQRLGAAGRAFVLAQHDWSVIVPKLETLLAGLRPED